MALLQCTKRLLTELKSDGQVVSSENSSAVLGNWHANMIRISRRKCVLFTNDLTLYSFLCINFTAKDFKSLSLIFIENLLLNLTYEEIIYDYDKISCEYINSLQYAKTSSRKILGSMNDMVRSIDFFVTEPKDNNLINLLEINHRLNTTPYSAIGYEYPAAALQFRLNNPNAMH